MRGDLVAIGFVLSFAPWPGLAVFFVWWIGRQCYAAS